MICGFLLVALAAATIYGSLRGLDINPLLVIWALFLVLFAGTCAFAILELDTSGKITKCRTPLVGDSSCTGFNDSWIECRWAFRAEGQPEPALCQRFLELPAGYQSQGEVADYDDVRSFSEVACSDWDVPDQSRCFEGARHEHEAANRYLLSFDSDCSASVVLRSCNENLEVAARTQHR